MSQRRGAMRRLLGAAKGASEDAAPNVTQEMNIPTSHNQNRPTQQTRDKGVELLGDSEWPSPAELVLPDTLYTISGTINGLLQRWSRPKPRRPSHKAYCSRATHRTFDPSAITRLAKKLEKNLAMGFERWRMATEMNHHNRGRGEPSFCSSADPLCPDPGGTAGGTMGDDVVSVEEYTALFKQLEVRDLMKSVIYRSNALIHQRVCVCGVCSWSS